MRPVRARSIYLFIYLFYLFLINLYWSIIASQYCVSFYCTTKQISHMHTYIPISPPSCVSLPPSLSPLQVIAKHRADHPVLCGRFPPADYFTFGSVCMSVLLSLQPSFPLSPCVLKSILYNYIFIPALQLGSSVPFFFLDSIYMCQHTVFVFLFLTYFTLYDRLQVHPSHYR